MPAPDCIIFEKPTKALRELFPELDLKKSMYGKAVGKIDGRQVFLEFVLEEEAITVLVNHGHNLNSDENVTEYELVRQVHSLAEADQIVHKIDWTDVNSEYLSNGWGFDTQQYGEFTSRPTLDPKIKGEVIWLDIELSEEDQPQCVNIGETLALAVEAVGQKGYFYDCIFIDRGEPRKCIVYSDTYGLNNTSVYLLVKKWIAAGGVI